MISNIFSTVANTTSLAWLLTTGAFTRPVSWEVLMHSGDPGQEGADNEIVAGDDPDYARQSITFGAANTIGSEAKVINNIAVAWTPGTGASYLVTHLSIRDADNDECLVVLPLSYPETMTAGVQKQYDSGSLSITLVGFSSYAGEQILNLLFGTEAVSRPAELWASLHTASPGINGANELTVGIDPSYVRKSIVYDAPSSVQNGGVAALSPTVLSWTAGADYDVVGLGVFDASAPGGGNSLFSADLQTVLNMVNGSPNVGILNPVYLI